MSDLNMGQIIDGLGQGVLVMDRDCVVEYWNRWMERASGLGSESVRGRSLLELYPRLDTPGFKRNLRSVLSFGIVAYFSQRVHGQLFPFPPSPGSPEGFEHMQQHCVMGPIRDDDGRVSSVYLVVDDVTETVSYQRRLAELALKDVLTSVYNRRFFDKKLAEELERARRYGHDLGLVMIDIDNFKVLNDSFGHQFGDEALKLLASVCSAAVRGSDIFARYGGEEFCIILPATSLEASRALAERLRVDVSSMRVEAYGHASGLTISAGVTGGKPGDGPEHVLRRADKALYAAKAGGRDRVEVEP
jgi:diguanylate cyclase (GGDEF)-like protein